MRGPSPSDVGNDTALSLPASLIATDVSSGVQRLLRVLMQERLGSGSYGVCFAAEEPLTGLRWCAKFARPRSKTSSPGELESTRGHLRQELAAMSRMDHPGVVQAIGLSMGDDGRVTSLLKPLYGGSLRDWTMVGHPAK